MADEYCLKYERVGEHHSRDALNDSGDVIAAKRFVTGGENGISYPAANTNPSYGLVRLGGADGKMCNVLLAGTGVATAGSGGVAANVRLTFDTSGKVVTWNPATGVNATVCAYSLHAASADADVEVEIVPPPGNLAQGA